LDKSKAQCIPSNLDKRRKKQDPKSRTRVFFGYSLEKKVYRVWDMRRIEMAYSRDMIFYE
jgi:hypothetical protein